MPRFPACLHGAWIRSSKCSAVGRFAEAWESRDSRMSDDDGSRHGSLGSAGGQASLAAGQPLSPFASTDGDTPPHPHRPSQTLPARRDTGFLKLPRPAHPFRSTSRTQSRTESGRLGSTGVGGGQAGGSYPCRAVSGS